MSCCRSKDDSNERPRKRCSAIKLTAITFGRQLLGHKKSLLCRAATSWHKPREAAKRQAAKRQAANCQPAKSLFTCVVVQRTIIGRLDGGGWMLGPAAAQ